MKKTQLKLYLDEEKAKKFKKFVKEKYKSIRHLSEVGERAIESYILRGGPPGKFNKIVILDKIVLKKEHIEKLKNLSNKLEIYNDFPKPKEVMNRIKDADAIIAGWTNLSKKIIGSCKNLKYIGVWATGYDYIPVDYACSKGIAVTNVPAYATESVAELVFAQLITMARESYKMDKHVRQGKYKWSDFLGTELANKTLGIIGLGNIGKRVAQIGLGYGMKVIYYSRTRKPEFEVKGVRYFNLNDLLKMSDIITLHVPLTNLTKKFIGKKEIQTMKKDSILINTCRGAVVDEDSLIRALKNKKIKVIFDVFDTEPPRKDLIKLKNTLFSPHCGWRTKEAIQRKTDICVNNVSSFLEGNPQNLV